jgi:hypothetical protein
MDNKGQHITMTVEQLAHTANAVAREHILQMLKELQEIRDKGMDLQNYILVKELLYKYSTN